MENVNDLSDEEKKEEDIRKKALESYLAEADLVKIKMDQISELMKGKPQLKRK